MFTLTSAADVRYCVHIGQDMLTLSSSEFDPFETWQVHNFASQIVHCTPISLAAISWFDWENYKLTWRLLGL
jgi:hypothetical protein